MYMPLHENGVIMSKTEYMKLEHVSMNSVVQFVLFCDDMMKKDPTKELPDMWDEFLQQDKRKFGVTLIPPNEVVRMSVDTYAERVLFGLVPPRLRYLFSSEQYQGEYVSKTRVGMESECCFHVFD